MAETIWINRELVEAGRVCISPFDHGLIVGDGVFETLSTVRGIPFAWTRHYERLLRSAAGLGFEPPGSGELREAVIAVMDANALPEARIRITVTSGPGPLGTERGTQGTTAMVAVAPPTEWPATADVVIAPWTRNERGAMVGLKTISYAENARALAWAKERDAGEAIFGNNQDHLCEGTGTNVYVVKDGRVVTPPLSSGCLDGVTRQVLLIVAPDVGVTIEEADLPVGALAGADEAFLSSATRGAQPIARVDGRAVPSAPGPITEKLIGAYEDLLSRELDP